MASKAKVTNVVVETKFNTAYVTYDSGVEKMYPADKMPKTVAKWLADHAAVEEEADPVEETVGEETEAVEEAVEDVANICVRNGGRLVVYYNTGTTKTFESLDDLPETVKAWLNANGPTYNAVQATESDEPEWSDPDPEPRTIDLDNDDQTRYLDLMPAEPTQTHREHPRRSQTPQPKSLALDIVDAVVSGLLMATRLSLIALAYLLMGLASACQAMGAAVEWLTPRAASLIDRSRAVWTETVRPAGKAAAVWMAEAVWFILI